MWIGVVDPLLKEEFGLDAVALQEENTDRFLRLLEKRRDPRFSANPGVEQLRELVKAKLGDKEVDLFKSFPNRSEYQMRVVTPQLIDTFELTEREFVPMLKVTLASKGVGMLRGDHPTAAALLGTTATQVAAFDVSVTYLVEPSFPTFVHRAWVDIVGKSGAKTTLPQNLRPVRIPQSAVDAWQKRVEPRVVSSYLKYIKDLQDDKFPIGPQIRQRFVQGLSVKPSNPVLCL
jgi:hypothetical protein